jgi:hypothetical protein
MRHPQRTSICTICRFMLGWSVAFSGFVRPWTTATLTADETGVATAGNREQVLGTLVDFGAMPLGPYQKGHLDFFRWPEEVRRRGEALSRVAIEADEPGGKPVLRVRLLGPIPFEQGPFPLLRLAPFLPPEADVVRVRLKVHSGRIVTFVGGPTAYYANSDAFTRTEQVSAGEAPEWTTIHFSFNHPLRRNYRRAGLSTDATRIYYNRWAQEPLGIYLAAGTHGDFSIASVEAVARGEGRPFATFAAADVRTLGSIADFEDGRTDDVFTAYMSDGETEWFESSWRRDRPLRFTPAERSIVDGPEPGTKAVSCVGPSAEEVHCTGLRTTGEPGANALRITLRHDAPQYRNTVVGLGRAEAIDFLVFTTSTKQTPPWSAFVAGAELRRCGGPGFDYQFSYRAIRDRQDVGFAIYQARRYVRPQEWTTLVLPTADFVCVYGGGVYRTRYLENAPLAAQDVAAVAWLNPWCRAGDGRSDVALAIDAIEFVRIPGTPAEHLSFWQLDGSTHERLVEGTDRGNRQMLMLLPGDSWTEIEAR